MEENALWQVANLALIVMGFSGVVAFLGSRAVGEWTERDVVRLTILMMVSARLILAAVLPLVLMYFGIEGKKLWSISSGFQAIFILAVTGYITFGVVVKLEEDRHSNRIVDVTIASISVTALLINALNAFGIIFSQSFGAYFLAIVLGFATSLVYLGRLFQTGLFPISKEQEPGC